MFMPYRFGDPVEEYWSLVNDVTVWDVAAERQVEIGGPDATRFIDMLVPRNLDRCGVGQCRYVVITDQNGFVINDPVLNRLEQNRYWLSAADSDLLLWAKGVAVNSGMDVTIRQPDVAPIQVQGGKSRDVMTALFGDIARDLKYYRLAETTLDGMPLVISRTGWSGDLGYEIYLCDTSRAQELWDQVSPPVNPIRSESPAPTPSAGSKPVSSRCVPTFLRTQRRSISAWNVWSISTSPPTSSARQPCTRIAHDGVKWKLVGIAFDPEASGWRGGRLRAETFVSEWQGGWDDNRRRLFAAVESAIGFARSMPAAPALGSPLEIQGLSGTRKPTVVETPFFDARKVDCPAIACRRPPRPPDRSSSSFSTTKRSPVSSLTSRDHAHRRSRLARPWPEGRCPSAEKSTSCSTTATMVTSMYSPAMSEPLTWPGVKVIGDYVDNIDHGLPSEVAMLTLYDPRTGVPRVLMDATNLTWLRTGAVTGIGARYLARPDSRVLAHVGARGTAFTNIKAIASVCSPQEVRITSRRPETREALAQQSHRRTRSDSGSYGRYRGYRIDGADIVVEATRLERPHVFD